MGVAEDGHGADQPVEAVEGEAGAEEDKRLLGQQPRRPERLGAQVLQGQTGGVGVGVVVAVVVAAGRTPRQRIEEGT